MVFNKETSPIKSIRLVRSNLGLLWEDFTIIGGIPPTGAVTAGHFIQLSGATGTITIVHKATNTLIGTWTCS